MQINFTRGQDGANPKDLSSTVRRQTGTITGPTSYATGGDTGLLEVLGWAHAYALNGTVLSNGTTFILPWLDLTDPDNPLVKYFTQAGAQVADLTDLSAYTGQVEFVGR